MTPLQAILALATAIGITLTVPPVFIHVEPGADLQTVLQTAPDGATVTLSPGGIYVGHFACVRPVTLTTAGMRLPDGIRVTPADTGRLARLHSPDIAPALTTAVGVSGCRFVALEVTIADARGTAVSIGTNAETALAQLPTGIELRHVYIHGDPVTGLKRCLALHTRTALVADSHIADCKIAGADSQAIWGGNVAGPVTISNNYLEGSGMSILFGGDRVRIPGLVPADIVIVGNTLAKPLSWRGQKWTVKNAFELKNARRVRFAGNVIDGVWPQAQAGYAVLLTPRNQYGDNPWSVVEEVTIDGNTLRNVSSGFNLLGEDDEQPSQRTNRITIANNLVVADRVAMGGDGRCFLIGRAPQQIAIRSNTCINSGTPVYTYAGGTVTTSAGAVFERNIFFRGPYGFFADGGLEGFAALQRFYPGAIWNQNVVAGGAASVYPPSTLVPSVAAVMNDFVNAAAGDYRLKAGSPYQGLGVDVSTLP